LSGDRSRRSGICSGQGRIDYDQPWILGIEAISVRTIPAALQTPSDSCGQVCFLPESHIGWLGPVPTEGKLQSVVIRLLNIVVVTDILYGSNLTSVVTITQTCELQGSNLVTMRL
jgi:hypothetical protein